MPLVIQPVQPTRWGLVVNPIAGKRYGPQVALKVRHHWRTEYPNLTPPAIHLTDEDQFTRIRGISRWIDRALKSKASNEPVGVIAFGGDGTINDTLLGTLFYLFPKAKTIPELYALMWDQSESLTDTFASSGIYLGNVGLGSACDIARLYGAPQAYRRYYVGARKPHLPDINDYMKSFQLSHLNLGIARTTTPNDDINHNLFIHSFSTGKVVADLFERTNHLSGNFALQWRKVTGMIQALKTITHLMTKNRDTTMMSVDFPEQANHAAYSQAIPALELLAHNLVSMAEMAAFPGTPQPGLGIKIFPDHNVRTALEVVFEIFVRGRFNLSRLTPKSNIAALNNIPSLSSSEFLNLQESLNVGQSLSVQFTNGAGHMVDLPAQVDGDAIGLIRKAEIKALPPYPYFMLRTGSVMASLSTGLRPQITDKGNG